MADVHARETNRRLDLIHPYLRNMQPMWTITIAILLIYRQSTNNMQSDLVDVANFSL